MRNVGLFAFGVTLCVLVPAAVNRLTAGREQVAKLFAPSARTLELENGVKVDVALDRALVDPGDAIHVKLVASAATARHVTVGVLVLGSNGTEEVRVPSLLIGVAHETVHLDVDATGHATKEAAGVVGLYARARCGDDCRDVGALYAGAVESTEILAPPTVAGTR